MLRTPKFLSPAQTSPSPLDFQTQPSNGNQAFPSGCIIDISSWTHPKEDLLSFHTKCVPSCLLISICYHSTPVAQDPNLGVILDSPFLAPLYFKPLSKSSWPFRLSRLCICPLITPSLHHPSHSLFFFRLWEEPPNWHLYF